MQTRFIQPHNRPIPVRIAGHIRRALRQLRDLLRVDTMTDALTYAAALAAVVAVLGALTAITAYKAGNGFGTAYRQITLNDDGMRAVFVCGCETVGEMLDKHGVVIGDEDFVSRGLDSALNDGDLVYIRRAMTVYLVENTQEGKSQEVRILSGTVADALAMSVYSAASGNIVSPPRETPLTPGMTISVDQVTSSIVTAIERVYYKLVTQKDDKLETGKTRVITQGVEGEKQVNYEVVFVNGEEVSRKKISEIITKPAIDKVVGEGTKIPATPKPSAAKTATPKPTKTAVPTATIKGDNTIVVAGKSYTYSETMVVTATAYTHTGNKTASGKWPKAGMMAVDRSLLPFGTKAYVPGYGIAVAEDVGGFRGNHIDLFMDTHNECINWGRKRNLTIYILE